MLVQTHTDRNIDGHEGLARHVEGEVRSSLAHYSDRLTRVEVFLGDENSARKAGAADKRCTVEARPAGLRPVVATHEADTVELALDGALDSVRRALGHAIGKLRHH